LKVLFAVHDWGLGHATRDLVLIRGLLAAGHAVSVISAGRALRLLRSELDQHCEFIELRDIPKPLSRRAAWFYVKMSLSLPAVFLTHRREHQVVQALCHTHGFECVVSDSRFGVCSRDVPSYYIFHSLRQIIPGRPRQLERMVESAQKRFLRGARKIFIPDQERNGLAGDLCHDVDCDWGEQREYIGILSSVRRLPLAEDLDYFISVSGAEPQRTIFEKLVLEQVGDLQGRVVVALGRPELQAQVHDDGRVAIHNFMGRRQQEEMMNRARLIVSRSGYTTLMELAELGKRALFVPTVGQSEQEYLADYHERLGHIHSVRQSKLRLARDVAVAETYAGLPKTPPTEVSVANFLALITGEGTQLGAKQQYQRARNQPDRARPHQSKA
jgi:UDP:flavonoid glycosyltransferase YjiC (YdhE family)